MLITSVLYLLLDTLDGRWSMACLPISVFMRSYHSPEAHFGAGKKEAGQRNAPE
jgi:hypothetical protein